MIFLLLHATEVQHHLSSLVLGIIVGPMRFIFLSRDNVALFVEPGHLVVHALHGKKFLLQELLGVDQVRLRLANRSCDLLTCSLRRLLQCDLLINLGVNLLLKPDVD